MNNRQYFLTHRYARAYLAIALTVLVCLSLLYGLLFGKDVGGRPWELNTSIFHFLSIFIGIRAYFAANAQCHASVNAIENGKPIRVRSVIETESDSDGDAYYIFVRSNNIVEANLINWRAEMLRPLPLSIDSLVEIDSEYDVWFDPKSKEPVLTKFDNCYVELRKAKAVRERWNT